jgi:hypothetical protein
MKTESSQPARCGIDAVEIRRLEKLLRNNSSEELAALFTATEIQDAGDGPGQAQAWQPVSPPRKLLQTFPA